MSRFPRQRPGRSYLAGSPLLIAHRGGAKLAPENTLAAFRRAVDVWEADMLELDVRATSDGEIVVIHDATVDRTTDGTGEVADLPWEALQELDAGHRFLGLDGCDSFRGKGVTIPRFEELLEGAKEAKKKAEELEEARKKKAEELEEARKKLEEGE